MPTAKNKASVEILQEPLDQLWALVDGGEPRSQVIKWLRAGSHRLISDWAATKIADFIERGVRHLVSSETINPCEP